MSDGLTKQVLESEVKRLQEDNDRLYQLLNRPITVDSAVQHDPQMQQIITYLPQLTQMATNMSYVASNITQLLGPLERIAKALEQQGGLP